MDSATQQQADAWMRVTQVLDEVSPGWLDRPGNGMQCAERAIRDMAGEKALREIEAAESRQDNPITLAVKDLELKLGRPLQMSDMGLLHVAICKSLLPSTNESQS